MGVTCLPLTSKPKTSRKALTHINCSASINGGVAWDSTTLLGSDMSRSVNLACTEFQCYMQLTRAANLQIKFPQSARTKHGFPVIVNPVRHAEIVANIQASWTDVAIQGDPHECAPDAQGKRHAADYQCSNWVENDYGCGCAVDGRRKAEIRLETLEWTPTLLDHYWEHGIEGSGMEFLGKANFVWRYE